MTDIDPADCALSQTDAEALRWFWSEGSGFGIRSSLGPQLDKLRYGLPSSTGKFVDPYTDAFLKQIDKSSGIRNLLGRLPKRIELTLRRYYAPGNVFQMNAFGDHAGVAPMTEAARKFAADSGATHGAMVSVCRALSIRCQPNGGGTGEDRRAVKAIVAEAKRLLSEASTQFNELRSAYDDDFRIRPGQGDK